MTSAVMFSDKFLMSDVLAGDKSDVDLVVVFVQGPSLLKKFGGGTILIVCVSMTSPCSLNRSPTFF